MNEPQPAIEVGPGDILLIIDVQNDFLPGGSLAVPEGDAVIPALNHCIALFSRAGLPIYATRDWHPPNHCSFQSRGGPWPAHCIAGSEGAAFAPDLRLPADSVVISKATHSETDAYSGFQGTDLEDRLRVAGGNRLFVGGLATDYCVLNTVRDALQAGFEVVVLGDAIAAVNLQADDGARAIAEMEKMGARFFTSNQLVV